MSDNSKIAENIVKRIIKLGFDGSKLTKKYSFLSGYDRVDSNNIWDKTILDDIFNLSQFIFTLKKNGLNLNNEILKNKKIASIELQTTDYTKKMHSGFINTFTITVLDFEKYFKVEKTENNFPIEVIQFFNIKRSPDNAINFIGIICDILKNVDITISFDKTLVEKNFLFLKKEYELEIKLPEKIISLNHHESISIIETHLNEILNYERVCTNHNDLKQYYKSYKGFDRVRIPGTIDPLGIYNITNTFVVLLYYIIENHCVDTSEDGAVIINKEKHDDKEPKKRVKRTRILNIEEIIGQKSANLTNLLDIDEYLKILKKIDKISFTAQQYNIIQTPHNTPEYIVAGPGSGKTTMLVYKVLKFLFVDGLLPEEIFITTFTKKAASELKGRIIDKGYKIIKFLKSSSTYIPNIALERMDLNKIITGTLDSIIEDMFVKYSDFIGEDVILIEKVISRGFMYREGFLKYIKNNHLDYGETLGFIRDINKLILNSNHFQGFSTVDMEDFLLLIHDNLIQQQIYLDYSEPNSFEENLYDLVETNKDKLIPNWNLFSQADYESEIIVRVNSIIEPIRLYRNFLETTGYCDFATLENKFLFYLEKTQKIHPIIDMIKIIMIDEYQDTNFLQQQIYFSLIKRVGGSVTIVGDDDQSMYRFRGAVVNLFKFFPREIKKLLKLPNEPQPKFLLDNFRSTAPIIDFYNKFLQVDNTYFSAKISNPARIPGKPLIKQGTKKGFMDDFPVLFLLGDDIEDLADKITKITNKLFLLRKVTLKLESNSKNIDELEISLNSSGKLGDCVLLSSSTKEKFYDNTDKPKNLPPLLRNSLEKLGIKVFNPRGQSILTIYEFKVLLGLFIMCIESDNYNFQGLYSSKPYLFGFVNEIENYKKIAENFINTDPSPNKTNHNHNLNDFVNAWYTRTSLSGKPNFPEKVPLLDIIYKLITWIPKFQTDPEYLLYLETLITFISNVAVFSTYQGNLNIGTWEESSLRSIFDEIIRPIINGDLQINEDLIDEFPMDRFNMMSIHQSKGLEFPLVFVDVCSEFKTNSHPQKFKRFPEGDLKSNYALEAFLSNITNNPPDGRTPEYHAFDDLIRKFFVSYSRPKNLLILVGIIPETKSFRNDKKFIPNIAVGYDRDGIHSWYNLGTYPWVRITKIL